jgi:hypothetical protein
MIHIMIMIHHDYLDFDDANDDCNYYDAKVFITM